MDWTTVSDRFWSKVNKTEACWLWQGNKYTSGYGQFYYTEAHKEHTVATHRVSYQLAKGEIPPGLLVLHKCDVRNCVNPDHLWLGTYKDNMIDCVAKGRNAKTPITARKLTQEQADTIRTEIKSGLSRRQLSFRYKISMSSIYQIERGNTYKGFQVVCKPCRDPNTGRYLSKVQVGGGL